MLSIASWLNATVGKEARLILDASDNDINDNVTVTYNLTRFEEDGSAVDISEQAVLSKSEFTWTPMDDSKVYLE